jgi:acyl-CoA thioesterase FadM
LVSAGLPCSWLVVEIRCRFSRQLALDVEVDVWGLEQ